MTKFDERFGRWSQADCAKPDPVPEPATDLSAKDIREMQRLLNQLVAKAKLRIDGKFGPKTADALERWQRENDFTVDGLPSMVNLERLRKAG